MQNKKCLFILAASALMLAACTPSRTDDTSSPEEEEPSSSSVATPTSEDPTPSSSKGDTSEEPPASSDDSTPASSSEEPTEKSTDIFQLVPGSEMVSGDEAGASIGQLTTWSGDGGVITSSSYENGKLSIAYTASTYAFYGVQVFYKAPYTASGDSLTVKMNITSSVTGSITVATANNDVVALEANVAKAYEGVATVNANGTAISIQLGTSVEGVQTPLGSGTITFDSIELIDTVNTYHDVTFTSEDSSVGSFKVKEGEKIWHVPSVTAPQGKVFAGWYDGDTLFDTTNSTVTKDLSLVAKYIDESEVTRYTVTYKIGDDTVGTASIIDGQKADKPSYGYDELGFGYGLLNDTWYTDADCTTAYDFAAAAVTKDLTLYGKRTLKPSATYNWGNQLPASGFTYGDSELSYSESGLVGGTDVWGKQINFVSVPKGETGKNYTLSFEYKINLAGGDVQIYDNGKSSTVGTAKTLDVASEWTKITLDAYAGGTISDDVKLTFELGRITGDLSLSIRSIAIAESAAA